MDADAERKALKPLKIESVEVKCPRPGCHGYLFVYPGGKFECNDKRCGATGDLVIVVRDQNEWGVFYQNETWRVYETRWDCCTIVA